MASRAPPAMVITEARGESGSDMTWGDTPATHSTTFRLLQIHTERGEPFELMFTPKFSPVILTAHARRASSSIQICFTQRDMPRPTLARRLWMTGPYQKIKRNSLVTDKMMTLSSITAPMMTPESIAAMFVTSLLGSRFAFGVQSDWFWLCLRYNNAINRGAMRSTGRAQGTHDQPAVQTRRLKG